MELRQIIALALTLAILGGVVAAFLYVTREWRAERRASRRSGRRRAARKAEERDLADGPGEQRIG